MSLYKALIDFRDNQNDPVWVSFPDDENVVKVKSVNNNNRGKSLLSFNFYYSDFVKLFVDEHDSNEFYINAAFDRYSSYNYVFVDGYYMDEEWNEGYIYHYFNDENKQKLQKIAGLLNPNWATQLKKDRNYDDNFFKFLASSFSRYVNDITSEYASLFDEALVKGLREDIKGMICNKFTIYSIFERICGESYYTTVDILINLWKSLGVSEDVTIFEFFKKLIREKGLEIEGDLSEDYHSYYNDKNFDFDRFNREVERNLDAILEKIEEDMTPEDLEQIQKFVKLIDKYQFGDGWNEFPKQKSFGNKNIKLFKIEGFDDAKIKVIHGERQERYGSLKNLEGAKLNYEEFLNFLFHPELFD